MNPTDPLSQLRDIHLPQTVGWWPLAPGWWLAGLILILLIAGSSFWAIRRYQKLAYRREALGQLETIRSDYQAHQNDQRLLSDVSALLKRAAITRYGRDNIAGLTGARWLEFLDQSGQTTQFSNGAGQALAQRFGPAQDLDSNQLLTTVEQWLNKQT